MRNRFAPALDPNLGPCCCCEYDKPRNIIMLPLRSPVPGTGWGCWVCHLPADGASYICCDGCLADNVEPTYYIKGYPALKGRGLISELKEPFDHDLSVNHY